MRTRILATLVRLAAEWADLHEEIEVPCTQRELAKLAGLTRNSVGPVLKQLAGECPIDVRYMRLAYNPIRLALAWNCD